MISFSSGCVINLDDLDDYPDYYQVITNLKTSFDHAKFDDKSLQVFLDADLEDVQHIPEFRQLITLLIEKQDLIFTKENQKSKDKFLILLLKMTKSYFTTFTMEDQQAAPIINLLLKQLPVHPRLFCDFWLSISKFAPYVQNHKLLAQLYLKVVDEKEIFKSEELSLAYVKSVDKVLRFHIFRQTLQSILELRLSEKNQQQKERQHWSTPFLNFKISRYGNQAASSQSFQELVKFVESFECSKFLRDYIEGKRFSTK